MLYAKVSLGLAVDVQFDYSVPEGLSKSIRKGARVKVDFCNRKKIGYVTGLTRQTKLKATKPIIDLIDRQPLLDDNMLSVTKELADYYCCSWGEAIETALPQALRRGVRLKEQVKEQVKEQGLSPLFGDCPCSLKNGNSPSSLLIQDLDGQARWDVYLKEIQEVLARGLRVILLMPDIESLERAQELISAKIDCSIGLLYRKEAGELEEWSAIKEGKRDVVIATRSGVFTPCPGLGLIIVEEEDNSVYKQDQVPHYHAREVAFMRAKKEGIKLILGSQHPSLESIYLARKGKFEYRLIPRSKSYPEIKVSDMRFGYRQRKQNNLTFSKYLEDAFSKSLAAGEKCLLFINRKGFATFAYCHNCGVSLKCQRCNVNLVYHFDKNSLSCHYCNYKIGLPKICPACNSGYIKFSGAGTEKMESELSRVFPQAKIRRLDNLADLESDNPDIYIATSYIFKRVGLEFDLTGVLSIDNSLNRIDLRSSEKAFDLLLGLAGITRREMIVQSGLLSQHCFQALIKNDINIFYDEELRQRKQLDFPPYRHLALVKLRAKLEEKAQGAGRKLFDFLNKANTDKCLKIISVNPSQPSKLRGNFYWQILISADRAVRISAFLKKNLKNFRHSGIIVTVDVDPI
ncbi:MAG: primosomal protein N' [Candidatus Omnitrophica bacterium]|nr:primosomal protein N' [Candidatus Omnitrophota bacterium]